MLYHDRCKTENIKEQFFWWELSKSLRKVGRFLSIKMYQETHYLIRSVIKYLSHFARSKIQCVIHYFFPYKKKQWQTQFFGNLANTISFSISTFTSLKINPYLIIIFINSITTVHHPKWKPLPSTTGEKQVVSLTRHSKKITIVMFSASSNSSTPIVSRLWLKELRLIFLGLSSSVKVNPTSRWFQN